VLFYLCSVCSDGQPVEIQLIATYFRILYCLQIQLYGVARLILFSCTGKLELHEADLLKEGSFDAAVKGAHFVFHTASPFQRCALCSACCQQQQGPHTAGLKLAAWLASCWFCGEQRRVWAEGLRGWLAAPALS